MHGICKGLRLINTRCGCLEYFLDKFGGRLLHVGLAYPFVSCRVTSSPAAHHHRTNSGDIAMSALSSDSGDRTVNLANRSIIICVFSRF